MLVPSDLKRYKAAVMGTSMTAPTPIGGAYDSGSEITGAMIGEVNFRMVSAASDQSQYQTTHWRNTNASNVLFNGVIYGANFIADVATKGAASVESTDAADVGTTYKAKLIGLDDSTTPVWMSEEILYNGVTPASGSETWTEIVRLENRLVSSNALTALAGTVTLKIVSPAQTLASFNAAVLKTATNEVAFGVTSALDTSETTTDASTAPSGISFSRPNAPGSGIAIPNSGTLSSLSNVQVWRRWTVKAGAYPSEDVEVGETIYGEGT